MKSDDTTTANTSLFIGTNFFVINVLEFVPVRISNNFVSLQSEEIFSDSQRQVLFRSIAFSLLKMLEVISNTFSSTVSNLFT